MQASRFVYDGTEANNSLLIEKARSSVRKSGTGDWRKATDDDDEDEIEDEYVFVSCDTFFEEWWNGKPAGMSTRLYNKLSQQAYDALVDYMQTSSGAEIIRGVKSGDGAALLSKLHGTKGDKRTRCQFFGLSCLPFLLLPAG